MKRPLPASVAPPRPRLRLVTAALGLLLGLALVNGCVVVPQNRRGHLADPMMRFSCSRMDGYRNDKLHSTREGAAGGNGQPAGGGCACQ